MLGGDDSRYWFHPTAGRLHAENPPHALAVDLTPQGVEIRSKAARLGLALRGYGYGDALLAVRQAAPQSRTNRVEFGRGALTEWYVNGPLGLEQGFTLTKPPGKANGRPLTVALALSGDLTAALDPSGTALTLTRRDGQAALRFAGLAAYDATGRELRGRFALRGEELLLQVDDAGARYPLVVDPFAQQAKLTASDGTSHDFFGVSVALSSDGNTALVGARAKNSGQGAAYVFTRSSGSWTQQQELTASDGAAFDFFGTSVALSSDGNTALVGARTKTVGGNSAQGAAYVFTRSSGSWTQQQELTASDGAANDAFGASVALSSDGNTALVGAYGKTVGGNSFQGAAYVFTRLSGSWTQQQELTASDGAANDAFGFSVALSSDGNTALVGAYVKTVGGNSFQGAAYVFTRLSGSWTQQQELTASDGATFDLFGSSVALSSDGNTALVGAVSKTIGGNSAQGAAYVFTRSSGSWTQQQELTASDGAVSDTFGSSVALSSDGNTALVGASNKTVGGNSAQGAAYVFTRSSGSWTQQQELTASDGATGDLFGVSVALSSDGNTALVGAYEKNSAQGAAYVFGQGTAPLITSAPGTTLTVGMPGTFTVTTTGTPTPTISDGGATLPSGVTFVDNGNGTGTLSGTPGAGTGGTYNITITASNGVLPNATQNLTLTVDQAPAITGANSTTFTVGTAGLFSVTATGFPAPTFSETGALPSGVTLSSAGVLSGTPGAGTGGTYNITITASNGVLPNATQNFTLKVADFTISATPLSQTISSGHSASYTIALTSVGGLTGNVSLSCSGNPTGSTCTVSPSSVMLNGTATTTVSRSNNHGTFTLTFTGTLGNISHSTQVSLSVK